jgi:hypothetical protein
MPAMVDAEGEGERRAARYGVGWLSALFAAALLALELGVLAALVVRGVS